MMDSDLDKMGGRRRTPLSVTRWTTLVSSVTTMSTHFKHGSFNLAICPLTIASKAISGVNNPVLRSGVSDKARKCRKMKGKNSGGRRERIRPQPAAGPEKVDCVNEWITYRFSRALLNDQGNLIGHQIHAFQKSLFRLVHLLPDEHFESRVWREQTRPFQTKKQKVADQLVLGSHCRVMCHTTSMSVYSTASSGDSLRDWLTGDLLNCVIHWK